MNFVHFTTAALSRQSAPPAVVRQAPARAAQQQKTQQPSSTNSSSTDLVGKAAQVPPPHPVANGQLQQKQQQQTIDYAKIYGAIEQFELGRQIGKGQFSAVFRARNKSTGELVALKRIELDLMKNKKAKEDCRKEIDLLKKLDHVNIIRYYASFIVEDRELMIVLELADAGDLNRLLKHFKSNHRLLPERTIWKYFVQIARALAYMHSKSIMHRDIKPANVFITSNGVAKLGDLGLGRYLSMNTYKAISIVGTPYYMSPERMNETGYSFKSDIWSLGCLLYEMAALQSPFFGEKQNLYALMRKIDKCEYPPIPSNIYTQQLRLTVSNCICNNAALRFDAQQVQTIAEHMHRHFSQLPPVASSAPSRTVLGGPPQKSASNASLHQQQQQRQQQQKQPLQATQSSATLQLPPVCPSQQQKSSPVIPTRLSQQQQQLKNNGVQSSIGAQLAAVTQIHRESHC